MTDPVARDRLAALLHDHVDCCMQSVVHDLPGRTAEEQHMDYHRKDADILLAAGVAPSPAAPGLREVLIAIRDYETGEPLTASDAGLLQGIAAAALELEIKMTKIRDDAMTDEAIAKLRAKAYQHVRIDVTVRIVPTDPSIRITSAGDSVNTTVRGITKTTDPDYVMGAVASSVGEAARALFFEALDNG